MKWTSETKIYAGLFLVFLFVITSAVVYDRLQKEQLYRQIEEYQPLIVQSAEPEKPAYKRGEMITGVFSGERFTTANSVLNRQFRCTNGYRLPEQIPLAGRPIGKFHNSTLQLFIVPEEAGGTCNLRFSERFDEFIGGFAVSKTVTYEFDITVID